MQVILSNENIFWKWNIAFGTKLQNEIGFFVVDGLSCPFLSMQLQGM